MITTLISASIACFHYIHSHCAIPHHTTLKLASLKKCKGVKVHLITAIAQFKDRRREEIEEQQPPGQIAMANVVTHSSIEPHEPLLIEGSN